MNIRKSVLEKRNTQKRSGKRKILIALMFLALVSPKAWGYAEKELPPSFSEDTFSSGDTFSSDDTFSLSRAVLTNEKGVALCQVNLVENPQFLPQFAEPGSSDLPPLDLPECEEQSLDIVAQYAEQAWIKKEVALAPAVVVVGAGVFAVSCVSGAFMAGFGSYPSSLVLIGSAQGAGISLVSLPFISGSAFSKLGMIVNGAAGGILSGLICYGITDRIVRPILEPIFYE